MRSVGIGEFVAKVHRPTVPAGPASQERTTDYVDDRSGVDGPGTTPPHIWYWTALRAASQGRTCSATTERCTGSCAYR